MYDVYLKWKEKEEEKKNTEAINKLLPIQNQNKIITHFFRVCVLFFRSSFNTLSKSVGVNVVDLVTIMFIK